MTTFYIWHDEGCCNNSTDDIAEARRIERELRDDGHSDVYVTDENHKVLPACCHYCDELAVAMMRQSSDVGRTVRMIPCCANHRAGWWDGADWDGSHLEVECETPVVTKFLVAEGWSHIFEDFGECTVRFVYNSASKKIVSMGIADSLGWISATQAQMDDVTDSLVNANEEALVSPENFGLNAAESLPDWAAA